MSRFSLSRRELLGYSTGAGALTVLGCRAAPAAEERAAADDLLAELTDQSGAFAPIGPAERAPRRARRASLCAEMGVDALLVEPGPTLTYLSGVRWGRSERLFGLIVTAAGESFWIVPAFESESARRAIAPETAGPPELVPWDEHEYAWRPLAAALQARGIGRVAVDPSARVFVLDRLGEAFGRGRVVSAAPLVARLRSVKEPRELALLRGACELTQRAIAAAARHVVPGMRDIEVGALVRRAQERLGLAGTWCLSLAGPDAALPHGSPEGRILARGDVLLVDTGGALHGYQSDVTRTWFVGGRAGASLERAWHTVRDAQQRAFDAIRPGLSCREIDARARATIAAAGFGEGYAALWHRLGHGIGLEGHEDPYFDGASEVVLEPGMTLSDEPGIYVLGEYGIRLEDIVAVTDDGAEVFGAWQRSPAFPDS
jgi:Xaa-Pro dipeptidase